MRLHEAPGLVWGWMSAGAHRCGALIGLMFWDHLRRRLSTGNKETQRLEMQTVTTNEGNKMDIVNQKLGTVGDIHVSVVDGKLIIGVDGDLDLVAQLEKLRAGHQADFLGGLLSAAESGLKSLTASKPAASS